MLGSIKSKSSSQVNKRDPEGDEVEIQGEKQEDESTVEGIFANKKLCGEK
jgi:hypothetical protein